MAMKSIIVIDFSSDFGWEGKEGTALPLNSSSWSNLLFPSFALFRLGRITTVGSQKAHIKEVLLLRAMKPTHVNDDILKLKCVPQAYTRARQR